MKFLTFSLLSQDIPIFYMESLLIHRTERRRGKDYEQMNLGRSLTSAERTTDKRDETD